MAKKYETLHDLFILKLQALYAIENELVKALPKMAKNATDEDLKEGFTMHLDETRTQVERLEQAFTLLEMKQTKTKVEAIRGLAKDAEWVIKNINEDRARDAALISAARYVEHYEMAGYLTAIQWAQELGYDEVRILLEETLQEEMGADEKLAGLAQEKIDDAANSDEDDEI